MKKFKFFTIFIIITLVISWSSLVAFAEQEKGTQMINIINNINKYLKSYNSSSYCDYVDLRELEMFGDGIQPVLHLSNQDANIVVSDFERGNYNSNPPTIVLKYLMDFYYADKYSFNKVAKAVKQFNTYSRYDGVEIKFFDGMESFVLSNSVIIRRDSKYQQWLSTSITIYRAYNPLTDF